MGRHGNRARHKETCKNRNRRILQGLGTAFLKKINAEQGSNPLKRFQQGRNALNAYR